MRNKGIGGKGRSIRLWARSLELESARVVMFLSSDIKGLAMKRTSLCVMPGNAIRELDRSAFGGVVRGVMDDHPASSSCLILRLLLLGFFTISLPSKVSTCEITDPSNPPDATL
ncbi:hypothetical protein KQX54_007000 [Cotesia glomerata]|uniref:Uncharacterized protein n=1 Tax=Cotesia glomerata TaxID=32391 RepID=A0AAV7HHR9_COTGL|nr:hypothetical protein KQX54_007000 [Cotesia glomerata]